MPITLISIHTTAKVVTKAEDEKSSDVHFNPHHREGGDSIKQTQKEFQAISIHTTAKVVTQHRHLEIRALKYFNPHHREGGDSC